MAERRKSPKKVAENRKKEKKSTETGKRSVPETGKCLNVGIKGAPREMGGSWNPNPFT